MVVDCRDHSSNNESVEEGDSLFVSKHTLFPTSEHTFSFLRLLSSMSLYCCSSGLGLEVDFTLLLQLSEDRIFACRLQWMLSFAPSDVTIFSVHDSLINVLRHHC